MTDLRPASADLKAAVARRLKARNAAERRFRLYGRIAIAIALGFLVLLLGRIVQQGWSTFIDYRLTTQVYLDPARIDAADPGGANYDLLIAEQLLKRIGVADDEYGSRSDAMKGLLSGDLGFQVMDKVKADPGLIGKTLTLSAPLKADAGLYFKGQIQRASPAEERPLSDEQLDWLDQLNAKGLVKSGFNTTFLTRSDSTDGLLGLAVFINWMNVPRSSPLVGGLVLALMSLPTVIIATRSALKAVPPSIREAALALGASRTQTVFHHVLPLALPGVMTGAILSLAHALGETAPLLMVGMVSFVPGVPDSLTSASTVLPVQIYIWENASERAFHERTAAAIMVLLAFMILMNLAAVLLRRRFERRW
jgi:phosphate transport system permease protein